MKRLKNSDKRTRDASEEYLYLYVDGSEHSREAQELLDAAKPTLTQAGASLLVTDGPVEPLQEKPLVVYRGGVSQGLERIRGLIEFLDFHNRQQEHWKRLRRRPTHALGSSS